MTSKLTLVLFLSTSLWAGPNFATEDAEFPPPWTRPALIQVGLVLDTGFNASGLIRQAQADLYDVINDYEQQVQIRRQLYGQIIDLASQRRAALASQIFSPKTPNLAFAMIRMLHEELPQRGFGMP